MEPCERTCFEKTEEISWAANGHTPYRFFGDFARSVNVRVDIISGINK